MDISELGARFRLFVSRILARLGFGEDSFILLLSIAVGLISGIAAVSFHELIDLLRNVLYEWISPSFLYGPGLVLIILFPALGGLAVGVVSKYVFHTREGHGIVDVVESVVTSSGFQKPITAIEKIITSALTIGTGGSAGAEGPIVQIGAAISSGVGQIFRVSRAQMPILIGCGCAAGISAIFNAPFGGVMFTLEVILQDFSIRTFTPIVLASVIAQVTTQYIFQLIPPHAQFQAIFAMPVSDVVQHNLLHLGQVPNFILLGVICALLGISLTRLMHASEHFFAKLAFPKPLKPALGGALLGVMGVGYILFFGSLLHSQNHKPFPTYPMPAFFGDGYGAIQLLLAPNFYVNFTGLTLALLIFLCLAKVLGTCLTLASGGSGGVIAPCVFIGATAGGVFGHMLRASGLFPHAQPEMYALVGMGGVLAAVVHAPLASILICFELTQDYKIMLPAMLACIIATGLARVIYADSIYTVSLRLRGVRMGSRADLTLLRRLSVEQEPLEPASVVKPLDPFQRVLDLTETTSSSDFVVVDSTGKYLAMVTAEDIRTALMNAEAIPLLVCSDVMRCDIPMVKNTDNLLTVLDTFSRHNVGRLPVELSSSPRRVIGLISRVALMAQYQKQLSELR
jgi:CIC family chloride channel protein